MTAFLQILQTVGLNAAFLGIIKAISLLYRHYRVPCGSRKNIMSGTGCRRIMQSR